MSRHREIRNLNINEELDDDALSDVGEDALTPEQLAQLSNGLDEVRAVLGSEDQSGLSDSVIKDTLWEFYFDVQKTVQWLVEEQERKNLAKERKDIHTSEGLRGEEDEYFSPVSLHQRMQEQTHVLGPRVPLIVLAQQQLQQQGEEEFLEKSTYSSPQGMKKSLSTITERTERTEASSHWPVKPRLRSLHAPRPPSSSSATSYGQIIANVDSTPLDPNEIPVSPSGSALQRLSIYEPAPSVVTSESRSSSSPPPRPPSAPVPPIDFIPEIPDFNSKSSKPPPPVKQSKLSKLASSRASNVTKTSISSRTTAADSSSSVTTYPALRPTSKSARPVSSVTASSTSSHIRRAIQTAIDLEAGDRSTTPTPTNSRPNVPAASSVDCFRVSAKNNVPSSPSLVSDPNAPISAGDQENASQPSKLALLAQAKAQSHQGPWMPKSKKVLAQPVSPGSPLPPSHTEFLTPIANGPTATTAITTSYHSLYSLTSPISRYLVPLSSPDGQVVPLPSPAEPKRSKLAMKIQKAHERPDSVGVMEDNLDSPVTPPIFLPKATRNRALPSAFASLLVDDLTTSEEKDAHQPTEKGKMKALPKVEGKLKHKYRLAAVDIQPSTFAFDVPSPDDIVFHARRNTPLAKHGLPTSAVQHPSPGKASTSGV